MTKNLKKFLSAVLALVFLAAVPAAPARADTSGLCFTAVNDRFLSVSMMPVFMSGSAYIRCDIFRELGISYSYFPASNAALLSSGSSQLVFYLNDGTCFNGDGQPYPLSATTINGVPYVPVWTVWFFGFTYAQITGTGTGDILRLKNGRQVLSDKDFLDAASTSLLSLYTEIAGGTQNPDPPPPEPPDINGAPVYLCFVGMPTAGIMDTLKSYGVSAAFFITAIEARENPDMVRRVVGEGSTVGIYCESDAELECEDAANAISEAAFFRPTIVTSAADSDEHRQYAAENGLVFHNPQVSIPPETSTAAAVTGRLPKNQTSSSFRLYCNENTAAILPSILHYLAVNGYYAMPLLETPI